MPKLTLAPAVAAWMRPQIDLAAVPDPTDRERWSRFLNCEAALEIGDLERLSRHTHIPIGYVFLEEPPVESDPLLVGWDGYPPRSIVRTIATMRARMDFASDMIRDYACIEPWAKVHDTPVAPPYPEARTLAALITSLEREGILVMQGTTVAGDPDWILDPQDMSAMCLYDDASPLIFLNGQAENKERLLVECYRLLTWRQDGIISSHLPQVQMPGLNDLLLGLPDGAPVHGEVLSQRFLELLYVAEQNHDISPSHVWHLCGLDRGGFDDQMTKAAERLRRGTR